MSMTTTGGNALMPTTMEGAVKLADMMARGKLMPQHLHNSPGDCLMVVEQAMRWGMSPFAVAQCTSVVKGKLMFEGKLVAAALHTSGALATRLDYTYSGEGLDRAVRVSALLVGEKAPRYVDVRLADARTTNEMWTKQPDQQLAYFGSRVWARRYAPEVMLGVYAPDDIEQPTPEYDGQTVDGVAEAVVLPDAPQTQEPPKRTLGQFIDALEIELRAAETWEAVATIVERDDVRRARDVAKNGMADRLSDMIDAAQERCMAQTNGTEGTTP
jgi:hypothetical protein